MSGDVWTLDEAKSDLDAVIKRAQAGGPQVITSDGKTVAKVIGETGTEDVKKSDQTDRPSLAEYLLTIPQGGDVDFVDHPIRPRNIEF